MRKLLACSLLIAGAVVAVVFTQNLDWPYHWRPARAYEPAMLEFGPPFIDDHHKPVTGYYRMGYKRFWWFPGPGTKRRPLSRDQWAELCEKYRCSPCESGRHAFCMRQTEPRFETCKCQRCW